MSESSPLLREGEWFREAVFYEIPVRSFCDSNGDGIGDLPGVIAKLDYLSDLGIRAIWLLPFYRSPWRDEGYDVSDHYSIDPTLGTIEDLDRLVAEAHARRIRVIGDLVTNHVSIDHPWFVEARQSPGSRFRPWFLWSDTGKEFSRARVINRDFETSNWTWDDMAGQYYFHRFQASQPDLNYDHPPVREEIENVARFWLRHGLDGFRCDAVPYLYKREGTPCQSLPEVHRFFRELRTMVDREFPGAILVAEANQSVPEEVQYLGEGNEFQMVMHFPMMPNLYLALGEGDPRRIRHVLKATYPTPPGCGWAHFLRNHDEVTLEQVSDDEREMAMWLYGRVPRSTVNGGIRRRLAPMLDGNEDSVVMITALLLALPGAAFLYYGDEIGMGDRLDLSDRDPVRTPMQWTGDVGAGFSTAPLERFVRPMVNDPVYAAPARNVADQLARPGSLLQRVRRLIRVHQSHPREFGPHGFRAAGAGASSVLAFWRDGPWARILCVYNFAREAVDGTVPLEPEVKMVPAVLAGGVTAERSDSALTYSLPGRGFTWLLFSRAPSPSGAT